MNYLVGWWNSLPGWAKGAIPLALIAALFAAWAMGADFKWLISTLFGNEPA